MGFAAVEVSPTLAAFGAVLPELLPFAALTTIIAEAVVLAVVIVTIRAEFVVHLSIVGVVHIAAPNAVVPAAFPPVSPSIPKIRPPTIRSQDRDTPL